MVTAARGPSSTTPPREVLEWAEKHGNEAMKARWATADLIAKECQSTLTVLLAGVGGSTVYAAKLFESGPTQPMTLGFAAACAYLALLCMLLTWSCMRFESYPAVFQEPDNLAQPGFTLDQLRQAENRNLSLRIREAAQINERRSKALNRVRIATAFTPLIFLIFAGAAALG